MIQVVKRVFEVLSLLRESGPLPLREIAEGVELKKTTCHNILKSLAELGVVECPSPGVYRIGPELRLLAELPISDKTLIDVASIHIERLAKATGETVVLAVLRGATVGLLDTREGARDIVVRSGAHRRGSPYRWATGRLLLAHASEPVLTAIRSELGFPSPDDWPEVAAAPDGFDREMARIRGLDVLVRPANVEGAVSLASPLRRVDGRVIAALGLALPGFRAEDRLAQARTELVRTADVINSELAALG
jgi:DNA-binding IclR family transcriptional regulator